MPKFSIFTVVYYGIIACCTCIYQVGVQLSDGLEFHDHFQFHTIFRKFQQRVNLLCFMGRHLPSSHILLLYKSYVRPAIEYAIPVWSFRITSAQLESLDVLQAKVCRRLLKLAKITFDIYESKSNLNRLCHLESLQFRRIFISLVVLFKYINFHPEYLSRFAITISCHVVPVGPKSSFLTHMVVFFHPFSYRKLVLFGLPPRLTTLDSLSEFKRHLRIHIAKYQFDCTGTPLMCNH